MSVIPIALVPALMSRNFLKIHDYEAERLQYLRAFS